MSSVTLDSLLPELKLHILTYLDIDELLVFSVTSKDWYQFISSDAVWLEKFRLFDIKKPSSDDTSTSAMPVKISEISPEEEKRISKCNFLAIHRIKFSFFLNRTKLFCNRLSLVDDITDLPTHHFYFKGNDEENTGSEQNNFNEKMDINMHFKIYLTGKLTGKPTQYTIVHVHQYGLANQIIDLGVPYSVFVSNRKFLLCKVKTANTIHVFKFSHEAGKFERTHNLEFGEKVKSEEGFLILKDSSVTLVGASCIWYGNLHSGEVINIVSSSFTGEGGKVFCLYNGPGERVLLIMRHCSRDPQSNKIKKTRKVVMLNLLTQIPDYVAEVDKREKYCTLHQLNVSRSYFVVAEYNQRTERIGFLAYNIHTGCLVYNVPCFIDFAGFNDQWYLSPASNILVIMGTHARMDKFFDLNDKTWHLDQTHDDDVANANQSNEDDGDEEYEDVDDETMLPMLKVDVEIVVPPIDPDRDWAISLRENFPHVEDSWYAEGPAGTLFRHSAFSNERILILTLVDYRHNRCIHVAEVNDFKLNQTQVEWDREYRRLMLSYFGEECDIYRVW